VVARSRAEAINRLDQAQGRDLLKIFEIATSIGVLASDVQRDGVVADDQSVAQDLLAWMADRQTPPLDEQGLEVLVSIPRPRPGPHRGWTVCTVHPNGRPPYGEGPLAY